jgi:MFS family permease
MAKRKLLYQKNLQYWKFSSYGFLKNLRFFDAFIILFLNQIGISYTQIGILYAIREIISFIMEVPSGIISDRFGRKEALLGSFILYILSFFILYLTADFYLLIIAFLLYGVADAFRSGTHKAMIMEYLTIQGWYDYKIDYYGHTRAWSQRGSAISALVAGFLVFLEGTYQNIFLYSIIPYILNFFLVLSYPKELNIKNFSGKSSKRESIPEFIRKLWKVTRNIKVASIISTSALHTAYLKGIKDFIQPMMAALAVTLPFLAFIQNPDKKTGLVVGVLYFFIYMLTAFASSQAGKLASKINRKAVIASVTLFMGLAFGLLAGWFYDTQYLVMAIGAFLLVYILENLRKPILTGYVVDEVPEEILTSVLSVQNFLKTIFAAIIAFLLGWFADLFGIGLGLVILSVALLLIVIILEGIAYFKTNHSKFD